MKLHTRWWAFVLMLGITALCTLPGCGNKDSVDLPPEPEDGVLIYAALNPLDKKLELALDAFHDSA